MAIVSATTLLRTISVFHITLAYYLLTSPLTVADQNLVYILGAAMDIVCLIASNSDHWPPSTNHPTQPSAPSALSKPSPALALASLIFALLGVSDLTATNLHEEISSFYWSSQAPIRFAFFLGISAYSFLWKPAGGALSELGGARKGIRKAGGIGSLLCNSVVFTWGFVEMLVWFWVSLSCFGSM